MEYFFFTLTEVENLKEAFNLLMLLGKIDTDDLFPASRIFCQRLNTLCRTHVSILDIVRMLLLRMT